MSFRAQRGTCFFLLNACHPKAGAFCLPKDPGEPRDAPCFLRRNNRAFGSLPYQCTPNVKIGKYSEISTPPTKIAMIIRISGSISAMAAPNAVCTSSS
jgi:hypothetical protein